MNQPMPEDMIGAIKIKDGLFIGDSFAAQVSYITPSIVLTIHFYNRIKNLLLPIKLHILSTVQGSRYLITGKEEV